MKQGQTDSMRKRIGILDFFLIFLLLLSALGIFLRRQAIQKSGLATEQQHFLMQATVYGVTPEFLDCIDKGETVYFASGEAYGTVTDMQILPAQTDLLEDGVCYSGEWELSERCNVWFEISFYGTAGRDCPLWHGTRAVLVGQKMELYSERALLNITVNRAFLAPE